jgi:hypothetical protein
MSWVPSNQEKSMKPGGTSTKDARCDVGKRKRKSKRPSIVDHILSGESWLDDFVEAINDRKERPEAYPLVATKVVPDRSVG